MLLLGTVTCINQQFDLLIQNQFYLQWKHFSIVFYAPIALSLKLWKTYLSDVKWTSVYMFFRNTTTGKLKWYNRIWYSFVRVSRVANYWMLIPANCAFLPLPQVREHSVNPTILQSYRDASGMFLAARTGGRLLITLLFCTG